MSLLIRRYLVVFFLFSALPAVLSPALAQSKNRAPGFSDLAKEASILVMTPDVELYSISAGGVIEPKADWTESAQRHLQASLQTRMTGSQLKVQFLPEEDGDAFAEISALHAAVAQSIALHHLSGGSLKLPTKNDQMDWSLGDAVTPIRQKHGADYALFVWFRDSYASSERKAAMFAMALLGIGISGGIQVGYASLVDLKNGQVLWFNRLLRGTGDLREQAPATETVNALLNDFPAVAAR